MKKTSSPSTDVVRNPFLEKHAADIHGILHGFDRIRLQGTLRYLYRPVVFEEYLTQATVLNGVEGCRTYRVYGNRQSRKLELRRGWPLTASK